MSLPNVYVRNCVLFSEGKTSTEDVWEKGSEENT
jgi:hypothetical protein